MKIVHRIIKHPVYMKMMRKKSKYRLSNYETSKLNKNA